MTLTIIARNPYTRQVGVAMASGSDDCAGGSLYMSYGAGIVSVQAAGDRETGALAEELMAEGVASGDILKRLREADSALDLRQIILMPFDGEALAYTGRQCIGWAGDIVKRDYALAANMISSDKTLAAMEKAYIKDMHAPMRKRLLSALRAGITTGGDVRGHKSAAIIIMGHQPFELRVTANADPVGAIAGMIL